MKDNLFFDNHSAMNHFKVFNGIAVSSGVRVSEYISIVKAKKFIRQLNEAELIEINRIVLGSRLNKYNSLTKEKLYDKLESVPFIQVLRSLYVRDKDGAVDAVLCLLKKKVYTYDYRFLNYYFKNGHEPECIERSQT